MRFGDVFIKCQPFSTVEKDSRSAFLLTDKEVVFLDFFLISNIQSINLMI